MNTSLLKIRNLIKLVNDTTGENLTYHHSTAALLFSALVYFSNDFIIKIAVDIGAEQLKIASLNGLKCIHIRFRGQNFVAFRGTESSLYSNWKRILNFLPKKTMTGRKAHRGFVMAFADCKRELLDKLDDQYLTNIIFCGHSLGGAMALLGVEKYGGIAYTFASPQVFFNENVNNKIQHVGFRIVGDFIPHVPPSFFFMVWTRPNPQFAWMLSSKYINPLRYHRLDTYISYVLNLRNIGK